MLAPPPPDQVERIETLHGYRVLDTAPEAEFDRIVRLAAAICETPIALISFVDEERQWFKARHGIDASETPIGQAICGHALREQDLLEIPDTLDDRRTADNPLCVDQGLRFYAGAVLRAENGQPLGTLCVLDKVPRNLTPIQRETLLVLAEQVMKQLDLKQAIERQEVLRREIDHRVKNSLASVSALIRLQHSRIGNGPEGALLDTVERRIELVSMLHGELYRARNSERVDMAALLETVVGYLRSLAPDGVTIGLANAPLTLGPRAASAVAYIVNEFIANAIKHGFADRGRGHVAVALGEEDDGRLSLVCSDDGVGFARPPGETANGLGMKIIQACAEQLGAEAEWLDVPIGAALALRWRGG